MEGSSNQENMEEKEKIFRNVQVRGIFGGHGFLEHARTYYYQKYGINVTKNV